MHSVDTPEGQSLGSGCVAPSLGGAYSNELLILEDGVPGLCCRHKEPRLTSRGITSLLHYKHYFTHPAKTPKTRPGPVCNVLQILVSKLGELA